jgi:hypothetical protein
MGLLENGASCAKTLRGKELRKMQGKRLEWKGNEGPKSRLEREEGSGLCRILGDVLET